MRRSQSLTRQFTPASKWLARMTPLNAADPPFAGDRLWPHATRCSRSTFKTRRLKADAGNQRAMPSFQVATACHTIAAAWPRALTTKKATRADRAPLAVVDRPSGYPVDEYPDPKKNLSSMVRRGYARHC